MYQDIPLGIIFKSDRCRKIDRARVDELAASIGEIGLINPICVRPVTRHRGTTPFDAYAIVAGHHRYEAYCALKHETIPCQVVDLDDLRTELAEIDENLIRTDLSAAQEAEAIARRKAIYEELHPETKAGVAGGKAKHGVAGDKMSFAESTASATGKDKRTVERAAARGAALGDDLDGIAGTSLDKGVELDALAKMTPAERAPLIADAKAGANVSARKPFKIASDPLPDAMASEKQVARLMDAWNAAGPEARQEFMLRIDAPIMDQRYGSAA